jgi:site-specific recombinase XerD
MAINDELAVFEAEINRIRRKLMDDDKPVSSMVVTQILKGDRKEKRYLLEYMDEHMQGMKLKGQHALNTCNHYQSSYNIYEQFINNDLKSKDYPINQIGYEFLNQFDTYMLSVYTDKQGNNVKRNTVNKHHSRLRTMLHKAVREEIISKNPYERFPLSYEPTTRTFLTKEEVNQIKELDFSNNPTLERVRDFFLFSCYTSLRFSDAINLRLINIISTKDGKKMIAKKMEKTKEDVYIPVLKEAQNLIDKYSNDPARVTEGYILPRYSNQKLNSYLKMIGTMAGISKELTHHVARHTFATIALNSGMPLEVVQKLLGHTQIRTTQIYTKLQYATLEQEMEKFDLQITCTSK